MSYIQAKVSDAEPLQEGEKIHNSHSSIASIIVKLESSLGDKKKHLMETVVADQRKNIVLTRLENMFKKKRNLRLEIIRLTTSGWLG